MKNIIKFSLRIPEQIHNQLKELADKDSRSLNNYIIKVLEEHINQMEQNKK
jgi:predicted HicB family RNase H-like nuclease